ncbi:tetratricopeptide repeat protein [Nonomuraea solani]|uniref:tetratricopeptide repeat protein n=1 Tax=Nonomuraea solani TaxID=1144553 RepID=UPI001356F5DD|nr:tetratricopeptide repeat protein [Nonomuraea solani]
MATCLVMFGLFGSPRPGAPDRQATATGFIEAAQDYLRRHPDHAQTLAELGNAYLERARQSGDVSYQVKAEGALRKATAIDPANVDTLVGLGALANARHDFPAARERAEQARDIDPRRWAAFGVLTDALVELGEYATARQALQQMLDLRPGVASFTRAAHLLWLTGDVDRARSVLQRASSMAVAPGDVAYCQYRLGELAYETGRPSEAHELFDQAARAGFGPALAGRARANAAMGRTEQALHDYAAAGPPYAAELGDLYESLGRHSEAQAQFVMFAALQRLQPDDLALGRFEADHGDPGKAVRLLRAEWNRRKSVDVADALGWALHRAGHSAEGLSFVRRADALGGRSARFAYHRGEITHALGADAEARQHLTRALDINPHLTAAQKALKNLARDALPQASRRP